MIINFYIKEDNNVGDDSMTITVIRNKKADRTQIINSKKLDDFTAIEQQNFRMVIATIEKYGTEDYGATEMGNNL